jgi:hypothetical protein
LEYAVRPGGESKITLSNGVKSNLFQDRLPPNKRTPDTGAILSIGHESATGSSALTAAPLLSASHSAGLTVSVTNDALFELERPILLTEQHFA